MTIHVEVAYCPKCKVWHPEGQACSDPSKFEVPDPPPRLSPNRVRRTAALAGAFSLLAAWITSAALGHTPWIDTACGIVVFFGAGGLTHWFLKE